MQTKWELQCYHTFLQCYHTFACSWYHPLPSCVWLQPYTTSLRHEIHCMGIRIIIPNSSYSRENTIGSTEPVINNQPHNTVDVRQLCGGPLSCRWRLLSLVWIRIIWCRSKVETAPPRHPFHCNDAESRPGDSWKQRLLPRNLKSPGHESSPFRGSNLASSANSANSTCFCHSAKKRWVVVEATSDQSNKKQEESFLAWHLYFWRYEAAGPQHSRTWLWQEGTWQSIMTGKRHYKRHHFVFSAVLVNLE